MEFLAGNPVWALQDALLFILMAATCFFVIESEARPVTVLMEALAFIFLYAMVYENFATLAGFYHYGRSLLMLGNVPLSIGFLEWLTIYAAMRMLAATGAPVWVQPLIVGLCGVLQDATIDPVAVRELASGVARWTWREGPGWSLYLGVPVYNFAGWFFLCGFSSAALLAGRAVHRKLGYGRVVGFVYPVVSMIVALGVLVSPLMYGLLWLSDRPEFGAPREWAALGLWCALGLGASLFWLLRRRQALNWRADWPALVIPAALHLSDLVFAMAQGYYSIMLGELVFTALHLSLIAAACVPRAAHAEAGALKAAA
jgi:hypothetical protein